MKAKVLALLFPCLLIRPVSAQTVNVDAAPAPASTLECPAHLAAVDTSGVYVVSTPTGKIAVIGPGPKTLQRAAELVRTDPPDALLLSPDAVLDDEFDPSGLPVLKPQVVPDRASTLVGRPDLAFGIARAAWGTTEIALLVHRRTGLAALPLALLTSIRVGVSTSMSITFLPPTDAVSTDVRLALLEHLYSLALRYRADGTFVVSTDCQTCGTQRVESQGTALRRLSTLRSCEGDRRTSGRGPTFAPWRDVTLTTAAFDGAERGGVAVRASIDGVPLARGRIIFSQGLAAGCSARSDADGVAACRLVDLDPDDDGAGTDVPPVIATFPGDVEAGFVLPPTTTVLDRPR